jgi:hypothetical protein
MMRAFLCVAIACAAAVSGPAAAISAELPARRAGAWDISIKLTGGMMPTAKMRHCTNERDDGNMSVMFNPLSPSPCPTRDIQKHSDRTTIDAVCRDDGKSITLHSDITGDFSTSYKVVTETKVQDSEDSTPYVSNLTLEGTYLGACRADEKPGDVTMAGGLKINVNNMEAFRKSLRR